MNFLTAAFVAFIGLAAAPVAQENVAQVPPSPYVDEGACPFECCVYREWTTLRRSEILAERRPGAGIAFTLEAGERVTAVSGVVITTRPGRIQVVAPVTLGEGKEAVTLQPGDLIYTLHYLGEGHELLWFEGRIFKDQLGYQDLGEIPWAKQFVVLELPTTEWWVNLRNRRGETGWTSEPLNFGNKDACG